MGSEEPELQEQETSAEEGAEAGEAPAELTAEEALEAELEKARAEAVENWDLYLRARAEMENVQRRAEREQAQALRFGPERLCRELIPALDSLDLALATAEGEAPMREGVEMTRKQLLQALEAVGVEVLDPQGQPFDPALHEAMTMLPSQEVAPDAVLEVVQKGYRLHDRLLRPARVVVAKAPD